MPSSLFVSCLGVSAPVLVCMLLRRPHETTTDEGRLWRLSRVTSALPAGVVTPCPA